MSLAHPHTDQRLNAVRTDRADPALKLAAAAIVVALADAKGGHPAQRAEAVRWLTPGSTGAHWAASLGGADALADALAELD